MTKIFLIAGMGADTRIFNNIELPSDYDVTPVDWIEPNPTDTLTTYAQKLIIQYNIKPNSIVIGNSLGGMLAIEMAKLIKLKKVILISSIKTSDEFPRYYKLFRALPVYKLVPGKVFTSLGFIIRPIFGRLVNDDGWLFGDMLEKTSPTFLKWAMGAALYWKNDVILSNVHHIVGSKDKIFLSRHIQNATIIDGGTHVMIIDRAKEINKWLKQVLKK